jgi:hypothetical protein
MTEQRAVEVFFQSLREVARRDVLGEPTPPALRPDDEITCQGFARNCTLEAANGR